MKEISLTKGLAVMIDDEDYDLVSQWKWRANEVSEGKFRAITARASQTINKCPYNYMHNLIMGEKGIDHIDGNPLNNQKSNLRVCSHRQNLCNRKATKRNKLGYVGVYYDKKLKRFRAQIKAGDKRIHIGLYDTAVEAAKAYDEAALKYHKEFACTNF